MKSRVNAFIKTCYQGWWEVNFLADDYWWLKRDAVAAELRKKSLKRLFIHE